MPAPHEFVADVAESSAGAHVIAAADLGGRSAFALADGSFALLASDGTLERPADAGACTLAAAGAKGRLVVGSDDGRVRAFDGLSLEALAETGPAWVDAVAARDDGAVAWSAGKAVYARDPRGAIKSFAAPSSVRGLAFLPKGYRLALACYNGVVLWFPNLAGEPERLEWRGSHLDVTASPDGRFVVSAMQENALHGWRLADRKNMRMTGYPSKTRSFSWSADGDWLATSGAEACIVWPFSGKDGPMGRGPTECGVRASRVSRVAFHPSRRLLAAGYEDGWILLCLIDSGEEAALRAPAAGGAVSALAWSADGRRLLYGAVDGTVGAAAVR